MFFEAPTQPTVATPGSACAALTRPTARERVPRSLGHANDPSRRPLSIDLGADDRVASKANGFGLETLSHDLPTTLLPKHLSCSSDVPWSCLTRIVERDENPNAQGHPRERHLPVAESFAPALLGPVSNSTRRRIRREERPARSTPPRSPSSALLLTEDPDRNLLLVDVSSRRWCFWTTLRSEVPWT